MLKKSYIPPSRLSEIGMERYQGGIVITLFKQERSILYNDNDRMGEKRSRDCL